MSKERDRFFRHKGSRTGSVCEEKKGGEQFNGRAGGERRSRLNVNRGKVCHNLGREKKTSTCEEIEGRGARGSAGKGKLRVQRFGPDAKERNLDPPKKKK